MAPSDAALAAALNGNFRDSLASMKHCLATAAAAADASGGAGVAPPIVPAVLDLELSERQKMAGGSMLKMDDDSWAIVQVNRATVHEPRQRFDQVVDRDAGRGHSGVAARVLAER